MKKLALMLIVSMMILPNMALAYAPPFDTALKENPTPRLEAKEDAVSAEYQVAWLLPMIQQGMVWAQQRGPVILRTAGKWASNFWRSITGPLPPIDGL